MGSHHLDDSLGPSCPGEIHLSKRVPKLRHSGRRDHDRQGNRNPKDTRGCISGQRAPQNARPEEVSLQSITIFVKRWEALLIRLTDGRSWWHVSTYKFHSQMRYGNMPKPQCSAPAQPSVQNLPPTTYR